MPVIFVVGEPGVGKSFLIDYLLGNDREHISWPRVGHMTVGEHNVVALGKYEGGLSDGPSHERCLPMWQQTRPASDILLLEGDGFLTDSVFDLLNGYDLRMLLLEGSDLAYARRLSTNLSVSDEYMLRHQALIRRCLVTWPVITVRLLTDYPPGILAAHLRQLTSGHHPRM